MKAIGNQLSPFSLRINSLCDWDFRYYNDFLYAQHRIHEDKAGWTVVILFKSCWPVEVYCRGYSTYINGERFEHGNITKEVYAIAHKNNCDKNKTI